MTSYYAKIGAISTLFLLISVSLAPSSEMRNLPNNLSIGLLTKTSPIPDIEAEFEKTKTIAVKTLQLIKENMLILDGISKTRGDLREKQIDKNITYFNKVVDETGEDGSFFRKSNVFVKWMSGVKKQVENNNGISDEDRESFLSTWKSITERTAASRSNILQLHNDLKQTRSEYLRFKPSLVLALFIDDATEGEKAHEKVEKALRKLVKKIQDDIDGIDLGERLKKNS